jgi:hypothetical protein
LSALVARLLATVSAAGMRFLPATLPARLAIRIALLARIRTLRIVWRNVRIIHRLAP